VHPGTFGDNVSVTVIALWDMYRIVSMFVKPTVLAWYITMHVPTCARDGILTPTSVEYPQTLELRGNKTSNFYSTGQLFS
jgi:hypothetical protein